MVLSSKVLWFVQLNKMQRPLVIDASMELVLLGISRPMDIQFRLANLRNYISTSELGSPSKK